MSPEGQKLTTSSQIHVSLINVKVSWQDIQAVDVQLVQVEGQGEQLKVIGSGQYPSEHEVHFTPEVVNAAGSGQQFKQNTEVTILQVSQYPVLLLLNY